MIGLIMNGELEKRITITIVAYLKAAYCLSMSRKGII